MKQIGYLGLLFSLLVICSCNQQAKKNKEVRGVSNVNAYDFSTPMNPPQLLSESQQGLAKNICEGFQNMRAFVARQNSGLNVDYHISQRDCGNSAVNEHDESANISYSRNSGVVMIPSSSASDLTTDVLSDRHQRLQNICTSILSGGTPSDTIIDGVLRYQVNFYSLNGYDWLQIAEFSKNSSGVYYPYLIDKAAIMTADQGSRTDALGFTKIRAVHRPCGDNSSSYTLQDWL